MRSTFKILFYIKRTALKNNGNAPIMARVTLDGEIAQFSLKCEVNPDDWDGKAGKAIGRTQSVIRLNSLLDNFRATLIQHYRTMQEKDAVVTAEKVKNAFLGFNTLSQTLVDLFNKHNEDVRAQLGKGKSSATLQKYQVTLTRLQNFMKYK